jgi:hypothetical protein
MTGAVRDRLAMNEPSVGGAASTMASDIGGMSVRDTSELRAATLEIAQIDEFLRSGAEPPR